MNRSTTCASSRHCRWSSLPSLADGLFYGLARHVDLAGIQTAGLYPAGSSAGPAPAPTVATIAPLSGPVTGGTPVTITGTGFVDGASVTVGGAQVTNVVVANPTTITANTPAHAPGTVDVVVTNPDGQSSNSKPFIYCSYTIAEINTSFEEHGGTDGEISVTTTSVCSWTAATSTPWIHSIEATPPSTLGSGTVKFSVRENPSAETRELGSSQLPVRRLTSNRRGVPPVNCGADYNDRNVAVMFIPDTFLEDPDGRRDLLLHRVARQFYCSHPDEYHSLVFFTTFAQEASDLAFFQHVRTNNVTGLGVGPRRYVRCLGVVRNNQSWCGSWREP